MFDQGEHGFTLRSIYSGMDGRRDERSAHRGGLGRQFVCRWALMNRQSFRSPLARAVGLGSAKKGSQQWWAERVTAVALVPLTLWFVASIIAHAGSDYATFIGWLQAPLTTLLMILLLIALFHHSALGLQVVIEDYVHSGFKFAAVIAVRLSCYGLAVAGIIATLRVAFGG
jgi:succinate dehydrogenase / fumarate reductase, membrane anchor subunit